MGTVVSGALFNAVRSSAIALLFLCNCSEVSRRKDEAE
jgi:hypothetical protein